MGIGGFIMLGPNISPVFIPGRVAFSGLRQVRSCDVGAVSKLSLGVVIEVRESVVIHILVGGRIMELFGSGSAIVLSVRVVAMEKEVSVTSEITFSHFSHGFADYVGECESLNHYVTDVLAESASWCTIGGGWYLVRGLGLVFRRLI